MKWNLLALAAMLGLGLAALGQEDTPTFRVTTSRAVVEFIAVDKDGRFVNDLRRDEIILEVDGREQKIDNLILPGQNPGDESHIIGESPGSSGQAQTQSGLSEAEVLGQRQIRTAILLDSRVLDAGNFHHSVRAIRKFVDESLENDHFVMLAEIDRRLNVVTPFTRDKQELLKGIDSLRPATLSNPLDTTRLRDRPDTSYIDDLFQQMTYLRGSMRTFIHSLSSGPGRKHVVLFSEGYPMNPVQDMEFFARGRTATSLSSDARQESARRAGTAKDPGVLSATQEMVSLANTYGISFYTVDARGLIGVPGLGADTSPGDAADSAGSEVLQTSVPREGGRGTVETSGGGEFVPVRLFKQTSLSDLSDAQNFLLALAGGTNGSAFFNSNDLQAVLRASTAEQRNVYLAGFEPKLKGKGPQFRRVKVKTSRKDVNIRAQNGFYDLSVDQLAAARRSQAFESPELFQGLKPILEVQKENGQVQAVFGIPSGQISVRPLGDKSHVELLFLAQVFKASGDPVSDQFAVQRHFKGDLDAQQAQDLASQPLMGSQPLQLESGQYKLVLVVEDLVAGTLGAAAAQFSVP